MKSTLVFWTAAVVLTACQTQPANQPASSSPPVVAPTEQVSAPDPETESKSDSESVTMRALAQPLPPPPVVIAGDSTRARQWLVASIEENFADKVKEQQNSESENPDGIYTAQYLNYKDDAIFLVYTEDEGALAAKARQAFERKWAARYNTRYVKQGGFLFAPEGYGKAQVSQCKLKESRSFNAFLFEVVIHDLGTNTDGKGDIKVINTAQGYKIDDVLEY
ncbi:hypothetical protein [Hymenobacter lucidus]|uniref:Lipoprotein n=1 Tax=Hymenobacter lucidus TaxID=2880930 RepID=A0ABS8AKI0_9BACT|nr:hypothetical protein [Hymenobacter lucidus]MCB2406720.1 hypothetical protein [Hymenobacter lucidus]